MTETIASIEVREWNVPMRSPYRSAQRITTVARNVLVRLKLGDSCVGYGESAPATYVTGETQESVHAVATRCAERLIGLSVEEAQARLLAELTDSPGARGALEMALQDAHSRVSQCPLFALYRTDTTPPVLSRSTDISLPMLTPFEAYQRAHDFARQGFRAFKIKVGSPDPEEDEARVRAVAEGAPGTMLRIDGNQGFTPEAAIRFVDRLTDLHPRLELFEQPTRAGDDLAMKQVQKAISLPVFADESVKHADDARRLIEEGVCRGIVLKIAKSGMQETVEIARVVREANGVCLFGCMMETRIGITAAMHLTVALGNDTVPMLDLDGHLLVDDTGLLTGGLEQDSDTLKVMPDRFGLSIDVNADKHHV